MLFDNKLGELLKLFQNMTKGDKEKLNSILEGNKCPGEINKGGKGDREHR